MKVDFIFDFASPNAYCCHKVIPEIQDRTGIKFRNNLMTTVSIRTCKIKNKIYFHNTIYIW